MARKIFRLYWPMIAAWTIYLAAVFIMVGMAIQRNDGFFVYPLDDTYVHMAIAKNTALYGTWGITRYEFTSSTSSPLWTALLTLMFKLFGIGETAPFVLNLIFGSLLIFCLGFLLRRHLSSPIYQLIFLSVIIFAAPLPIVTFISMEHILHGLLTLWFVSIVAECLPVSSLSNWQWVSLVTLSFLVASTRYEGLFAALVACILLFLSKKLIVALFTGIAGILPVALYGLWSVSNGWYFLPNSLLIKTSASGLNIDGGMPYRIWLVLSNLVRAPLLIGLVVASSLLISQRVSRSYWDSRTYLNIIFVLMGLLHITLAKTGYLSRYEAYLVILGLLALVTSIKRADLLRLTQSHSLLQRVFSSLVLAILLVPLLHRSFDSLLKGHQASTNIYEQQYQMAKFVKQFYSNDYIAVNDVGAISFFTDAHIVDLFGLANLESARAKFQGQYNSETIRNISHVKKTKIAIVYESWYWPYGGLPHEWQKIGAWQTVDNVSLADGIVTFFAVKASEEDRLRNNLLKFSPGLPTGVKQYLTDIDR